MKFELEALQANDGDCLLLRYGGDGAGKETLILIDGGARGIYKSVLQPRLDQLRAGAGVLDLRMVLVSHIDADHITGVQDMFRDLSDTQDDGRDLPYRIRTLWHNSFESLTGGRGAAAESAAVASALGGAPIAGLTDYAAAVVASVTQGNAVRNHAKRLGIPINQGAKADLVRAPLEGMRTVEIVPGLKFTILGPHDKQLNALDDAWEKAQSKTRDKQAQAADYLNRTVPNLSSIVILADANIGEGATKRMLLTGDAGGDMVQDALIDSGLAKDGKFHVDLLKVQHHGSNHSVDADFFRNITADKYVISGNGKHGIPHPDTLCWLADARDGETIDVYLTNREGHDGLTANLDKFLQKESRRPHHRYQFRSKDDLAISVPLARAS